MSIYVFTEGVGARSLPPGNWILDAYDVSLGLTFLVFVGALAWGARHRTALERRQGRWVLFGFFVALVPFAGALLLEAVRAPIEVVVAAYAVTRLGLVAVPLGFLISIVGSGFLDIDRIWSATATATLLAIVAIAVVLIGLPPLAETLSSVAGFEPAGTRSRGRGGLGSRLRRQRALGGPPDLDRARKHHQPGRPPPGADPRARRLDRHRRGHLARGRSRRCRLRETPRRRPARAPRALRRLHPPPAPPAGRGHVAGTVVPGA